MHQRNTKQPWYQARDRSPRDWLFRFASVPWGDPFVLQTTGVPQPQVSGRGVVACAMQRQERMKDLVLIGVSVAFFALSWIYARSFDRL
jgi:hypothetical protein